METKDNKKIPIIMLVGEGHSGSTLLDLIMDSHSQVVGVGELSHYSKHFNSGELCSCGKQIKDCEFWQKVFEGIDTSKLPLIYRKKLDFFLNKNEYFYYRDFEKKLDTEKYVHMIELVYKNILQVSGKKIVFDSSKNYDRAEALIKFNQNLDIILLHLVRDGRGVAYSNIKLGRNGYEFMKKWMISNLKIELVKKRNKNIRNIFISYEDFVKNPERVLKYILNQFDLSFENKMLNFGNVIHHQPGGNFNLRIKAKTDEIKLDQKWKEKMSMKDKIIFNILFGWLNLFYKMKLKVYKK